MKPREIEPHIRPYKVAIKALLRKHLPPLIRLIPTTADTVHTMGVPDDQTTKMLGVSFGVTTQVDGAKIVPYILNHPEHFKAKAPKDVAGIVAANALHSKMESLSNLLKNHPNPGRLPVLRGKTEEAPKPEDQEVNDLLLEAATLGQIHQRDFMLLMREE
ncbi:MAG: hypothetical protein GY906_24625 [bacterium]|nr:hypothetical protein [bacterium]